MDRKTIRRNVSIKWKLKSYFHVDYSTKCIFSALVLVAFDDAHPTLHKFSAAINESNPLSASLLAQMIRFAHFPCMRQIMCMWIVSSSDSQLDRQHSHGNSNFWFEIKIRSSVSMIFSLMEKRCCSWCKSSMHNAVHSPILTLSEWMHIIVNRCKSQLLINFLFSLYTCILFYVRFFLRQTPINLSFLHWLYSMKQ